MNVIVTLNAGLGSDLGPNFNLTSNGTPTTVTPSIVTKTDLLAGKAVVVDNSATQITVTSTGVCTNFLNLSITA